MNEFSFYSSFIKSKTHINKTISLDEFLYGIKSEWKGPVDKIRSASGSVQKKLKENLPYATISGIFAQGTREANSLISHSGLIQIDIDFKGNSISDLNKVKKQLKNDRFVLAAFLSPSGNGLKAIVKINGSKHLETFIALETYFKANYSLIIDKACKDVCRPFFVSYDPEIYINMDSEVFSTVGNQGKEEKKKISISDIEKKKADIETLCKELETRHIDITNRNGYSEWLNIGFAIANGLGETGREYYHRISSIAANYNLNETEKQFTACCKNVNGGRRWESLFGIAKDFNITINGKQQNKISNSQPIKKPSEKEFKFYEIVYFTLKDGTKQYKGIEIDEPNFLRLLYTWGFRRYDIGTGFSFIKIKQNVITEVTTQNIQDAFFDYLNSLPDQVEKKVTREHLLRLCLKKIERLFGKPLLSTLKSDKHIEFNDDTKSISFFYFKNGFVKCVADGYSFHPYSELKKCIWSERIINRNFSLIESSEKHLIETHGNFVKFLYNVCGQDQERFESLCTITGYLLHDYHEGKLKAVVLTDSNLSDENEGRTGKTLFGKALMQVRKVCELAGKDFKPEEKFKYQAVQLSTQIVFLNDARRNFNLETLYNDITEGITVEKKNQSPVSLQVKYLITTNAVIKTSGASSLDRVIEFEFSNHYTHRYSPEQEFKQWFFKDWTENEWSRFDNFLMLCLSAYLEGNVIKADDVNLQKRKFMALSSKGFYEFIQDKYIEPEKDFSLQETCSRFQELYPDYNFNSTYPTRRFAKWLKELPKYLTEFDKTELVFKRKNNLDHFYCFAKK